MARILQQTMYGGLEEWVAEILTLEANDVGSLSMAFAIEKSFKF
jgi:hypothetical protein